MDFAARCMVLGMHFRVSLQLLRARILPPTPATRSLCDCQGLDARSRDDAKGRGEIFFSDDAVLSFAKTLRVLCAQLGPARQWVVVPPSSTLSNLSDHCNPSTPAHHVLHTHLQPALNHFFPLKPPAPK